MIVTLTTDFGEASPYVAALKGVLLSVNPSARPVDLSHSLPPQNCVATAWFLADSLAWFPPKTVHVVVVDPGVGTERALLCVEWRQQFILVPDNGCWTSILSPNERPIVHRLAERRYWQQQVCRTFHGRDILAPVAGHLTLGIVPAALGPVIQEWVRLELPEPVIDENTTRGEVVVMDHFGNLLTNILVSEIRPGAMIEIDDNRVSKIVQTYGQAEPGDLVALIGSSGRLEVAVVNGSAASRLGVGVGAVVSIQQ